MQEAGRAVARQPGHWMETAAVFFSHTKLTLATNQLAIFFFSQQISISHSQQNRASSEVRKVGTRQRRINKAQANCNQFFLSARSPIVLTPTRPNPKEPLDKIFGARPVPKTPTAPPATAIEKQARRRWCRCAIRSSNSFQSLKKRLRRTRTG